VFDRVVECRLRDRDKRCRESRWEREEAGL
jgi:hypothetical protein